MMKFDIEGLSKSKIKNKSIQIGISFQKKEYPKDYYSKIYLEKSKKLKIGLKGKEEEIKRGKKREKGHKIEEKDYPNY